MKTKTSVIAIIAIFLATNVFAAKNLKFNITPLEDSKVLISINVKPSSKPSLTIVNDAGETIYFKRCKNNDNFKKQVFNFSNLENGNYEVKLTTGNTTFKNEMRIHNGVITVNKQNKEVQPYFSLEENLLKISFLNFEESKVEAQVYKKGTLIYEAEFGDNFTIHKGLDISNLEKGYYDLCLTNGHQNYWFSLKR